MHICLMIQSCMRFELKASCVLGARQSFSSMLLVKELLERFFPGSNERLGFVAQFLQDQDILCIHDLVGECLRLLLVLDM